MRALLILAAAGALLAGFAWMLMRTPAAVLARRLRKAGGVALLGLGAGLLFARQFALALPIGMAGFMVLRRQAATRPAGPTGQRSGVRSAGLDMSLDHDTGEMDGLILAGRHQDRRLSQLRLDELLELAEDFRGDAESLRLLESYLDRAHPGWRDDVDGEERAGGGAAARPGRMSAQEAYEVLGLRPGAGEAEIRQAHRRLMKEAHPDRGGSASLAARINEAKDTLLHKHG